MRVVATYNDETPDTITGIMPFSSLPKVGDPAEVYNFKTSTARPGYIVVKVKNGHFDIAIPGAEQTVMDLHGQTPS